MAITTPDFQGYVNPNDPRLAKPPTPTTPDAPKPPVTPTPPTGAPDFKLGDTGSQFSFANLMQTAVDRQNTINPLIQNKSLLLKQLYDNNLTPDEISKLPKELQTAVQGGDKSFLEMQIRLLNDGIAGRSNTLSQSVQFLTSTYQQSVQDADAKKQQSIANLEAYIKNLTDQGLDATAANKQLAQLIGVDNFNNLQGQGILGSEQDRTVRNNNPTAFTTDIAKQAGLVLGTDYTQGDPFTDSNGKTLYTAKLLGDPTEQTIKVIDKIGFNTASGQPRWSYINQIPDAKNWSSLSHDQKVAVINKMNQFESGGSSNTTLAPGTTGSSSIDTSAPGYATKAIARAGGLTQAAIDQAALKYVLTGTMPSLGNSSTGQGGLRKNAILARAGELDAAGNIEGNKVRLAALGTSLSKQTDYLNTMERSINTVDDNLKILLAGADKVNQSDSPLVNQWNNLVTAGVIGSGDLNAYKAAIQTVRTEYSNILARGGQVTDSQRSEAAQLIPDNITKASLKQVIGVLQAEGSNVKKEAQNQVDSITGQINGIVTPSNTSGGTGGPTGGATSPTDTQGLTQEVQAIKNNKAGYNFKSREDIISALVSEGVSQATAKQIVYSAIPDNTPGW